MIGANNVTAGASPRPTNVDQYSACSRKIERKTLFIVGTGVLDCPLCCSHYLTAEKVVRTQPNPRQDPTSRCSMLFRPCHPERSRNPSVARIKRSEAEFGSSDEKVRFRFAPLRMTPSVSCGAKVVRTQSKDSSGRKGDRRGVPRNELVEFWGFLR